MKQLTVAITMILIALASSACAPLVAPSTDVTVDTSAPADQPLDIFDHNRRLGRSINLGNALEAPYEGAWGLYLKEEHFRAIADAGFDAVRIPIRWSAYSDTQPPYAIKARIFERVDWAIEQALASDLAVVINIHHYPEIMTVPEQQRERFKALWQQIAEHYADAPDTVTFELLNEPNEAMTVEIWNSLLNDALTVVRESNPDRAVIVGPIEWNNVDLLDTLELPEDDRNIIATFHYYRPFEFTHQGASWVNGSRAWMGRTWTGTDVQVAAVARDLDRAASWSEKTARPIYVGEFGAYSLADMDSRAAWTATVVDAAESRGFSWAYWEFGSGFGAYNQGLKSWEEPLLDALIHEPVSSTE